MSTAVPQIEFTPTGLVLPAESAVLAGAISDFNAAFGGNLNPALNTPQGQLASSLSAIIADVNAFWAWLVNQMNPDVNSGFMQDAIGRIYFLTRNPGLGTVVQCTCIGAANTPIPMGSQVQDTSGNNYISTVAATIPIGGSVSIPFVNTTLGPIACPANTVTKIFQTIPGWDTVNNPLPGVAGANVESQAAFEFRREQSVALNARGALPSITANVWQVPGVIDVYGYENTTNAPITVGETDYVMVPHSIYIGVVGGDPQAVAQAIWEKKNDGSDYNGNTTETVVDSTNYEIPYPSYSVTFNIPSATPILFSVQVKNTPQLPTNYVSLVQAAIIAAFVGSSGGTRARMGALLTAAQFYPAVINIGQGVQLVSILLGSASPTLTQQLMGIDQEPTVTMGNISVTAV